MAADDTTNIEVQEAINKAIAARSALLMKQTEIMKGQVQLAIELANALKGENLEGMRERIDQITAGISAAKAASDEASSSITGMTGAITGAGESAEVASTSMDKMTKKGKDLGEILGDAFAKTGAQLDGVVGLLGSVGRGITSMGMAILSVPFKMFDYLVDGANDLMNGSTQLREAFENVRETFGDLNKAEAKGVINSFNTLQASAGSLGGSGLSLAKVFGMGQDGLAQALNALNETAAAMGPLFGVLQGQFEANADKLLVLQKGLGMSNEEMTALGSVAVATGGDMTQMMQEMGNLALQMGDKFGISSKLIGKDLSYMTANMGKFGSMTKTQMVTSSVYLRKLGLELKNIEGLMGAFDDFETAAGNAAKLAQGFGMTVDAFKMMKEQDPAKRLDMLRQAFAATGKSIESMSRQERAMLASSAGLDENMVSLALSSKNMGKSYDQIQKEADKSNKKQLSQAEVMDKLAENIKKMTESMSSSGGFMERFFKGFEFGLKHSAPFMRLFRNLGQALWGVEGVGRKVGKVFAEMFPGIKDMANALADFFDPAKFKELTDGLLADFTTFFEDLGKDPVKATENFMKKMKEKFFNFFDSKSKEGTSFKDGLMKFVKSMAGILTAAGVWLIKGAAEAVTGLANYLRNPKGLSKGAQEGIMSIVGPMLTALWDAVQVLGAAFLDLIGVVMVKYAPQIGLAITTLLAANIAMGLIGAVTAGAKAAIGEVIKNKFLKMFGQTVADVPAPPPGADQNAKGMGSTVKSMRDMIKELQHIGKMDIVGAMKGLLKLAALLTVGGVLFIGALAIIGVIAAAIGPAKILMGMAVMLAGVLALLPILAAMKILEKIDTVQASAALTKTLPFLGVMAIFLAGAMILAGLASLVPLEGIVNLGLITAVAIGALIGGALAAYLLMAVMPDGGITAGVALMASIGFMIAVGIFVAAFSVLALLLSTIETSVFEKATTNLVSVGIALIALAAVGVAALLAGAGIIAGAVGMVAIAMSAWLFIPLLEATAQMITDLGNSLDIGGLMKGVLAMAAVAIALIGLGVLGAMGVAVVAFAPLLIPAAIGILAIVAFFGSTMDGIKDIIAQISGIPVDDPDKLSQKVGIVKSVIDAMSAFGDIAISAAQLGVMSELFGGPDLKSVIASMSDFMTSMTTNITNVITEIAKIATGWSDADLKKMETMAKIIGAIAGMAGALSEPIKAFSAIEGEMFGDSAIAKMDKIITGVSGIMDKVSEKIPEIVKKLAGIDLAGLDETKADILSKVINAVSSITKSINDSMKLMTDDKLKDKTVDDLYSKAVGNVGTGMSILETNMPKIKASADALMKYKEVQLGGTVKAIVDDIKAVNDALADLGTINVNATIDKLGEALQLKTEVLNIERKPIELSVNLNLTMKAEDITKEIFDVAAKLAKKEGVPGTEPIKQAFGA